ncbi:MAG TPA: 2-polyprenyl-3-methyl-6-methoxy-1,4-benzoquinone monooxygenase [Gammaproteobacteria bacterium]|nr:2-polyprenyl-3-methyl-6-methoxy-1,4-benzoquinone monooxygenase [Gammaproteobacteria bacterium]
MLSRRYSTADRMIINLDRAVRSIQGLASGSGRPSPARTQSAEEMTSRDRRTSAALMRVNHAGEVAAQALYHGQALTARDPELRRAMAQSAREEDDHLRWCRQRLDELGGRTSFLDPFWYAGALTFGAAAGLAGDRVNLGFLAETEHQVVAHLEDHLCRLPESDVRSRAVLEQMREDEAAHARSAEDRGAVELPPLVKRAMRFASRVMTGTAYYV